MMTVAIRSFPSGRLRFHGGGAPRRDSCLGPGCFRPRRLKRSWDG